MGEMTTNRQPTGYVGADLPQLMPHLPIQLSITEAVECLLYAVNDQEAGITKSSILSNTGLRVKITTDGANSEEGDTWFNIRVKCIGLGQFNATIDHILKEQGISLIRICREMQKMFQGSFLWLEERDASIKTVTHFRISDNGLEFNKDIRKDACSVTNVQPDCPPMSSLSLCCKVAQNKHKMLSECTGVCGYLHRIKLMNPMCGVQFYLKVGSTVHSSKFDWSSMKATFGSKKMATDIQHFLTPAETPATAVKIEPKSGLAFTLVGVKMRVRTDNVKASAIAALLPPPGSTVKVISKHVTTLKVMFYGPGGVPLLLPGVAQGGVCPSILVPLAEFGLTVAEVVDVHDSDESGVVSVDWCYRVKPTEDNLDSSLLDWTCPQQQQPDTPRTLLVTMCLDRCPKASAAGSSLLDRLEFLDCLRQNFSQILCKYRCKLKKATRSAMNRVLLNHAAHDQKQELLTQAVSTVSQSIRDIIGNSDSDAFRIHCLNALQVDNIDDIGPAVRGRLAEIATAKHGVKSLLSPRSQRFSAAVDPGTEGKPTGARRKAKRAAASGSDAGAAGHVAPDDFGALSAGNLHPDIKHRKRDTGHAGRGRRQPRHQRRGSAGLGDHCHTSEEDNLCESPPLLPTKESRLSRRVKGASASNGKHDRQGSNASKTHTLTSPFSDLQQFESPLGTSGRDGVVMATGSDIREGRSRSNHQTGSVDGAAGQRPPIGVTSQPTLQRSAAPTAPRCNNSPVPQVHHSEDPLLPVGRDIEDLLFEQLAALAEKAEEVGEVGEHDPRHGGAVLPACPADLTVGPRYPHPQNAHNLDQAPRGDVDPSDTLAAYNMQCPETVMEGWLDSMTWQ